MSSKKRNSSYVQEVDFTFGTTKRGKRRLQSVLVPSQGHKTPQTPAHIRKSQMLSSLRTPSSQAPLPAPDFGTPGTFPSIQVPMPKVLRKSGLSQNQMLRDWLDFREEYLQELLRLEAPPLETACATCATASGTLRCKDCFGNQLLCTACCLQLHVSLPFHRLERLKNGFFHDTSLHQKGYVMYLGHGGHPCPVLGLQEMDDGILVEDEDTLEDTEHLLGQWETLESHVLVVVDCSGVHQRRISWCHCSGAPAKHIQLLHERLFPASVTRPSTVFTFNLLEYFHIDAVECKTAAFNFFSKMRRLTNYTVPGAVPNRYRELMRVSRMWRNLLAQKRAGVGYNMQNDPSPGSLAIFCPACPQPGINLSGNWKDDPRKHLYIRKFVMDGNFEASHQKMKKGDEDVALTDGHAYMVPEKEYQEHIHTAVEIRQKPRCHNHKAANGLRSKREHLDATGIAAVACARHGCFYPASVCDFQVGERQMNMDYAICQALKQVPGIEEALVCYDVSCQWIIHFLERVKKSPFLSLPEELKIIAAVGKFHLGAHVEECFPKFSLNFIKGIGQLDGEIIETLWCPIDKVAGMTKSMSAAHRRELLDDMMYDSNWKKWVGIVASLLRKRNNALKSVTALKRPFEDLTASLDPTKIAEWTAFEQRAMERRGNYLKIYSVKQQKAPSQADKRLALQEKEIQKKSASSPGGAVAWLVLGLAIEDAQTRLRAHIRSLGPKPARSAKTDLAERQERLALKIDKFVKQGLTYLTFPEDQDITSFQLSQQHHMDLDLVGSLEDEDADANDNWVPDEDGMAAENTFLPLPSSFNMGDHVTWNIENIAHQERELRIGQANDALHLLRDALASKSLIFRTQVRNANSQLKITKSWADVEKVNVRIRGYVRTYQRARAALIKLQLSSNELEKFQVINQSDLKMSSDIIEESRIGQRNDKIAWFWVLDRKGSQTDKGWMEEFYRINWLRSKARLNRWEEEVELVQEEMLWTVAAFKYNAGLWHDRAVKCVGNLDWRGKYSYALRQEDMWLKWANDARIAFFE